MNKTKQTYSIVYGLLIIAILAFGAIVLMPIRANAEVCILSKQNTNNNCPSGSSDLFTYGYTTNYYGSYNGSYGSEINPVIYLLNPNAKSSGSGPITITISGKNFAPGALAKWNGSDRVTTYIDSTRLLMQLNDYDTNVLGDFFVTVYNTIPGGGFSNPATFSITGTTNAPVVSASTTSNTSVAKTSTGTVAKAATKKTVAVAKKTNTTGAGLTASVILGFMPSNVIQWLIFLILALSAVLLWRKIYVSEKDKAKPLKHA
jgi:hypothetical protein